MNPAGHLQTQRCGAFPMAQGCDHPKPGSPRSQTGRTFARAKVILIIKQPLVFMPGGIRSNH